MPILVLPIVAATAVKVTHYGCTYQQMQQVLPLLVLLLNSMYIWLCTAAIWLVIVKTTSFEQFTRV